MYVYGSEYLYLFKTTGTVYRKIQFSMKESSQYDHFNCNGRKTSGMTY